MAADNDPPASIPLTAHAALELIGTADAPGTTCAVLTPRIKARLQELDSGHLLRVRVDDPVARVDVPAWCYLSGNELVALQEEAGGILNFYIRKR